MFDLVVDFQAIPCVVVVKANTPDIKNIKKEKADDKYVSDKNTVNIHDKKGDEKDNKKHENGDTDCDSKEAEHESKVKEKEIERKKDERKEVERKEAELKEAERKESQRKEAERKEAERKEAERKEAERKQAERKEAERKEAERKEAERKQAEKKEAGRKEAERKEAERRESQRKEAECNEAERKEKQRKENDRNEKEKSKEEEQKGKGKSKESDHDERDKKKKGKDCNDSRDDKIKDIWEDKDEHGNKKPCDNPSTSACNTICPTIANPICATPVGFDGDSKTFDNECQLNVYNCQNPKAKYHKTSDGACKTICPEFCPYYVKPFCALPVGWCGEPKTFGNPCLLAVYNCKNPNKKFKFFHDGDCLTTPAPEPDCGLIDCPQDIRPICGLPKGFCGEPKTFSNKCYLEVYNCFNANEKYEYFHDGDCLTTPAPEPDCGLIDCPKDIRPICGIPKGFCGEPKTFSNKCYLEVYNCFNANEKYEYFHDGDCLTTPAPEPDCGLIDCPKDIRPICGLPKGFCGEPKTFSNKCYLEVYNCFNANETYEYFHDGDCLTTPDLESDCTKTASCDDKPVCGLPNGFCGEPKTFANECYMKIYNAFNPNNEYKYFHNGACLKKPTSNCDSIFCTKEYFPFCAIPDGFCGEIKTFSNECQMDVYNCKNPGMNYKYFHEGECLPTPTTEPNCAAISCSNEGPAVCGLPDGFCGPPQTFTNGCNLKVYNCFNPTEQYKFFHDGQCLDVLVPQPEPNCDIVCLDAYNPICTLPEDFCGEPKTFGNECTLNAYNCINKNEKYKKFHDGKCLTDEPEPECSTICPAIYKPVCTLPDGFCGEPKTYSSSCVLASYNCLNPNQKYKYFHDGECIPPPKQCPTICPYNYQPVCARGQSGNVKTFSNKCDLDSNNCLNENSQYTFVHDGECNECKDIQCNKIGQPVCAKNGANILKTFGNPCMLQQYNCDNCNDKYEYLYDGSCNEPIICTKELIPVCALSPTLGYKTFSNKCLRDAYISQHPDEGYVPAYDGECKTVCKLFCPKIYRPVCGIDSNGNEKELPNQCEFDAYNCLNPNNQYTWAYEGRCNKCPTACIEIYQPVCCVDSSGKEKTWSNRCELDSYNCRNPNNKYESLHDGECLTVEPKPECSTICPAIYKPVCTLPDGFCGEPKTYSSSCVLASYNCLNPNQKYKYFHDGECIPPPKQCPTICPYNYQPVCARGQSGNVKTFSNKCDLDSNNCLNENSQYTFVHDGECNECKDIQCNKIGQPVCAKNGANILKTFGNPCMLQQYNCDNCNDKYEYLYDGSCNEPIICTKELIPVCALSPTLGYKTFSNKCLRDAYISQHPDEGYVPAYDGECKTVCKLFCPKIYRPVCGIDSNGNEKELPNQCEFDAYNCLNPNNQYTWAYEGRCNKCPTACIEIYQPVCCVDSSGKEKTWSNRCELDSYNCRNPNNKYESLHDGECLTVEPKPECSTICPAIYKPVCTLPDGFCGEPKTYSSSCVLASYNCLNPNQKYKYFHDGECIPPPKQCPTICPYNYQPVCARGQSGNVKTFSNKCDLDSNNCLNENSQYTFVHDGECNECKDIQCNKIGQPVCAKNGANILKTFGNPCMLQQYNCDNCNDKYEYLYDGSCNEPIICTKELIPVCALSPTLGYKTFSNKCLRDAYISQHPDEGYVPAYDGECKTVCKLFCPKIYRPVCGIDSNGNEKELPNQCEFDAYNCLNPNNQYTWAYEGRCNKCPTACIETDQPVCSVDSSGKEKTWSNRCELDRNNCRYPNEQYSIAYDGECNSCATACIDSYDPICGVDSNGNEKTFSNKCELDRYNCRYPKNIYSIKYQGDCRKCIVACTREYAPVCTYDLSRKERQFPNKCELNSYNCQNPNNQYTIAYEGECHGCTVGCFDVYEPVCSVDAGGNEKTWSNQCEFDSYNCRYPYNPLTVSYAGECHQCATICTAIYKPVCAKDSSGNEKTWGNQCELNSYNCRYPYKPYTVQYQGECQPKCLKPCPKIIEEICADDGKGNTKTFDSECEMDNINCQFPDSKYTILYKGKCEPVCQDICPAIYKPVCGSPNGDYFDSAARTFPNQCAFDSYNCHNPTKVFVKATDGECPVNCKTLKCKNTEKWICGTPSDGKGKQLSFINNCVRLRHNCDHPEKKYNFCRDGKCKCGCE